MFRKRSDSESESHPLMSSDSSYQSYGENQLMFPGSETSDFDRSHADFQSTKYKCSIPIHEQRLQKNKFNIRNTFNESIMSEKFQKTVITLTSKPNTTYLGGGTNIYTISGSNKHPEQNSEKSHPTQSSIVTIFSIWNTIMGSSLLVMAWGVEMAGFFPSIIIIIAIGSLCLYTAYILLQVSRDHGFTNTATEVPELCRLLLGPWAEYLAKAFSIIVLLGASVVYWVLMSNFLYNSVQFIHDAFTGTNEITRITGPGNVICPKEDWSNFSLEIPDPIATSSSIFNEVWDLYSTVPVFLGFILFPFLNFKNTTFFTKFNCLGTCSVMYLLIFVATKSTIWGINIRWSTEPFIRPTFTALTGMLSLSFFIHNIIISIVKNNKHQKNNVRDISIAFSLVTFTYLFVGVIFHMCFPLAKSCIEDNIFNNFEKSDAMTVIARFLLLFQIFTTYPLITFMLRKDVLILFMPKNKIQDEDHQTEPIEPKFPLKWVFMFNIGIVLICILVACFIPKVGTLVRYAGAVSGFVWIFTLPCLLRLVSLKKQGKLTLLKTIFFLTVPVIGALNLFSQFFIST